MSGRLYMDAVITPNRSIGPQGLKIVLGVAIVGSMILSVALFIMGAWIAPLFLAIDVFFLWLALRSNFRAAERRERLQISAETVKVIKENDHLSEVVWESPTAFTALDLEEVGEHQMRVRLRLSGKRYTVGRDLSPEERVALGEAIDKAIRAARADRHPGW